MTRVAQPLEGLEQELQPDPVVVRVGEREHVLEEEHPRPRLIEDTDVVLQQARFGIEARDVSARSSSRDFEKGVHGGPPTRSSASPGRSRAALSRLPRFDLSDVALEDGHAGEIRSERTASVRVVLDSSADREPGLLDPKIEAAAAREK